MHSLTSCIEYYLEPELMDGENKYYAESIGKKVDAIKGLKFHKLPQVLSIQLKRFVYEFHGESIIQKKLNDQIRFPFVLDMNKYVATRSNYDSNSSQPNRDDNDQNVNEEFEQFIQERIDFLKRQKEIDSSIGKAARDDLDIDFEDATIPDLVHYDGSISADQLEEELRMTAEERPADPRQLIREHGRWVYELYGVLVHSGAISGGHYYAYIRDLSTRKWYNFNDSNVSEIPETQVHEAWGGSTKKRNSSSTSQALTSSGGSSADRVPLSNANAYMLMYRQVNLNADGNIASVEFPGESLIPDYIKEEIRRVEDEDLRRRLDEEKRNNQLSLRVIWRDEEKTIITTKSMTYRELITQLWNEFSLQSLEEFRDQTSGGVPYHLLRLRFYNTYYKILQDVYDFDALADKTLRDIRLVESRILYLESRDPEEDWQPYDKDGSTLLLIEYDENTNEFKLPKYLRMSRGAKLCDLRQRVKALVSYPPENIRFMKLVDGINYEAKCDELVGESSRLRDDLWLYDMQKIYFEERKSSLQVSPAKILYTAITNNLILRVSQADSSVFDTILNVDRRWTISKLRDHIAERLQIPPESFRMLRQSFNGQEIKDTGQTLHAINLCNDSHIAIVSGEPLKNGQYVMNILLYVPAYEAGVKYLCGLEQPAKQDSLQADVFAYSVDLDSAAPSSAAVDGRVSEEAKADLCDGGATIGDASEMADSKSSPEHSAVPNTGDFGIDDGQAMGLAIPSEYVDESDVIPDEPSTIIPISPLSTTPEPVGEELDYSISNIDTTVSFSGLHGSSDDIDDLPPLEAAPYGSGDRVVVEANSTNNLVDEGLKFVDMKVVPSIFTEQFPHSTKIVVDHDLMVESLRAQVARWLRTQNLITDDVEDSRIRLRERQTNQVARILRDGRTLRQSDVPLYDGRSFVAQILEKPEHLPPSGGCSVVALVRRWHRPSWSLGDVTEVFLDGSRKVKDISGALADMFGIRHADIRLLVLSTYSDVLLSNLDKLYPCTSRHWIDGSGQHKCLNEMQWHLVDGDVIIVQDSSESLRVMSSHHVKTVNYSQSSDFHGYNGVEASWLHQPHPVPAFVSTAIVSNRNTNGIRIKTFKDRQRESAENLSQTTGSRNASPDIVGDTRVTNDVSVTPTEDGSFWGYDDHSNSCNFSRVGPVNINSADTVQFTKSGGLALFDDIC